MRGKGYGGPGRCELLNVPDDPGDEDEDEGDVFASDDTDVSRLEETSCGELGESRDLLTGVGVKDMGELAPISSDIRIRLACCCCCCCCLFCCCCLETEVREAAIARLRDPPLNMALTSSQANMTSSGGLAESLMCRRQELKLAASGCTYLDSGRRWEWKMNLLGEKKSPQ